MFLNFYFIRYVLIITNVSILSSLTKKILFAYV